MKNTWLKLNEARCDKMLKALEGVPFSDRDPTWNHLVKEIKQVKDVWDHIDIKTLHNNKFRDQAKITNRKYIPPSK